MVICSQAASISCWRSSGIISPCTGGFITSTEAGEAFESRRATAASHKALPSSFRGLGLIGTDLLTYPQASLDIAAAYDYVEVLQLVRFLL